MKKSERIDRVCRAALELSEQDGWESVSLPAIAAAADIDFADLFKLASSKTQVLILVSHWFDRQLLAELDLGAQDQPARDRLFDIMMQRLDVLDSYKDCLRSIYAHLRRDPTQALALRAAGLESVRIMMEAAGLSSSGLSGAVRLRGLGLVWIAVVRAWFKDDDPGLARTMAVLDRRLRQWEGMFLRKGGRLRSHRNGSGNSSRDGSGASEV